MRGISFLIILFITNLLVLGQEKDFFFDWETKSIVSPTEFNDRIPPSDKPNILSTIDFGDTLNRVSKYVFGINVNTYSTSMINNDGLMKNLKNFNPHVLRYPGGNLSNHFYWNANSETTPTDIPPGTEVWYGDNQNDWTLSVDNYYKVLEEINATGMISVNYGYARYGTSDDPVAQAAHLAADWVRYDNGHTKYWEIGNENYGNWNSGYEIDTTYNKDGQPQFISGKLYAEHALVFIDSMRKAAEEIGKEILIGVQAIETETSYDPIQSDWNEQMMPIVGDAPDFYIVHSYYTPYNQNSTAQVILNSYSQTKGYKEQVLKDLEEAGLSPKPIALTEYNIFATGSQQAVSNINGLHASLVIGSCIENGINFATRWDIANGYANGDDHGMFSKGDPDVDDFTPYPDFFHLHYFQKYFGDRVMKTVTTREGLLQKETVVVFASSFSSGQAGLVLINKSEEKKTVQLNMENFVKGQRAYWFQLDDINKDGSFSKKVKVNGKKAFENAGGPEDYENILPYSFELGEDFLVDLYPYTAIYMLVDGETVVGVNDKDINNLPEQFSLEQNYPNPFNPSTKIKVSVPESGLYTLKVYNVLGQEVATLLNDNISAGTHTFTFNSSLISGNITSGIYFYRFSGNNFTETKKMTLMK